MAKPAAARKPPEEKVEYFDFEQRSDEWFAVRRGVLTASRFAIIMGESDEKLTRQKLLYTLAGEQLSGVTSETFRNEAMERGIAMEPAARAYYERTRFVDLEQVGFVRRTIPLKFGDPLVVGCSPDSRVKGGKRRKLLQIKTTRPDLLIAIAEKGAAGFPVGHRAQCQGELWVDGADVTDLMIFYEGMPVAPTFTMERDDAYIAKLRDAAEVFAYDLKTLVERIRKMGRGGA